MKKISLSILLTLLLVGCNSTNALPQAELAPGIRGEQFGIDKNINEETIDQYLNRSDCVYRDMRMLIDPAQYENLEGGDSYLSGFVKGFEVVPLPYIIPLSNLPEAVGEGYTGPTLFSLDDEKKYVANYYESLEILHYFFPTDKNILLMCGGGGYAGMMKKFLIEMDYDANKIYNTGGYWYYNGNNKIQVKRIDENKEIKYDFWKVTYHEIVFEDLTKVE